VIKDCNYRILDAPNYHPDYYCNLMTYNDSLQLLAVCLDQQCFLMDRDNRVMHLSTALNIDEWYCSVSLSECGTHSAIGSSSGSLLILDNQLQRLVRNLSLPNAEKILCSSWNDHLVSFGSSSGNIYIADVRVRNWLTKTLQHGDLSVCSVKWSPNKAKLATGANSDNAKIWDLQSDASIHTFEHSVNLATFT
jgi:cell division cycle protein 20 (cofactor of APC complex)